MAKRARHAVDSAGAQGYGDGRRSTATRILAQAGHLEGTVSKPETDRIRVCLLQVLPDKGELATNYRRLLELLDGIPETGIDAFVTPECYLDGYVVTEERVTREGLAAYAVAETSEYVHGVRRIAAERGAWFIFGCTLRDSAGCRNAALVVDRRGEIAGRYYKTHCQRHDTKFVAGNELPVFPSEFGPFGVMICADRRWPETVRTLALGGARVIFNPTYGMHDERNMRMMQTRSYESEVFICFAHPRQALVTDPRGALVACYQSAQDGYLIYDIDLAEADRARAEGSRHLTDRRPELYR